MQIQDIAEDFNRSSFFMPVERRKGYEKFNSRLYDAAYNSSFFF